ncbi:MAG: SGNH/GDSL hydrolase family protein [Clostridia bacterium]|nr:SGNH/GDSL hydrolase family protein [Clostridia bacterium]
MSMNIFRGLTLMLAAALLLGALPALAEAPAVFTQEMIERSFLTAGNTERIQRAISKAKNGEDVSIVYLGGSITEGSAASPQKTKCYAYLSAQLFAEKFMADKSRLQYHNAGISGTPSLLGVTRCEKDVLAHNPDIVFVEFAVNDGGDANSRLAYESLVCKLLESPSQPAVVLIFTVGETGWSAQDHMQKIGKHYDLGMISIKDAVWTQIQQGQMTWRDYSSDYVHPNNAGHAFMADCIAYWFDQAAAVAPVPYVLPKSGLNGRTLAAIQNLGKDDPAILSMGCFDYGTVACYSYKQGWRHMSNLNENGPMILSLDASLMTVVVKQERNTRCGKAEVWVDGKLKTTLNCYADNAWGNPVTQLIYLGRSDAPHTVEIRMAEGSETKTFTLLDVGYAK